MTCTLERSAVDAVWASILQLRSFLDVPRASTTERVFFYRQGGVWRFSAGELPVFRDVSDRLVVPLANSSAIGHESACRNGERESVFSYERYAAGMCPFLHPHGHALEDGVLTAFRLYLPLLLGAFHARRRGVGFVTGHVAQTLDGRIACRNGHSQWISNEANLRHAHRLRALHDAVLVGRRTVELDDPRLDVRHVDGEDPARVILSASASILRSRSEYRVFAGSGSTVLCRSAAAATLPADSNHENVRVVPLDCPEDSLIAPEEICRALFERGWSSLFVEGGGLTLSSFLERRAIDVLHVHVAPVILGSGIDAFTLPEVQTIRAGRQFRVEHFTMDGELLIECRSTPESAGSAAE